MLSERPPTVIQPPDEFKKVISNCTPIIIDYLTSLYFTRDNVYSQIVQVFNTLRTLQPSFVPSPLPQNVNGIDFASGSNICVAFADYVTVLQSSNQNMNRIAESRIIMRGIKGDIGIFSQRALLHLDAIANFMMKQDGYKIPTVVQESISLLTDTEDFVSLQTKAIFKAVIDFYDYLTRLDMVPDFSKEIVVDNLSFWLSLDSVFAELITQLANVEAELTRREESVKQLQFELTFKWDQCLNVLSMFKLKLSEIVMLSKALEEWGIANCAQATIIGTRANEPDLINAANDIVTDLTDWELQFREFLSLGFYLLQLIACNSAAETINFSCINAGSSDGFILLDLLTRPLETEVFALGNRITKFVEIDTVLLVKNLQRLTSETTETKIDYGNLEIYIKQADQVFAEGFSRIAEYRSSGDEIMEADGKVGFERLSVKQLEFADLIKSPEKFKLQDFIIELNSIISDYK